MLIFDEADSMLFNRLNAVRSWETSMVNEFLAQMDSFKGMLVCMTNLLHNLDPAAIRRFDRKVAFLPLLNNQIEKILCEYFPTMDFTAYSGEILKMKGATPGDIAVIAGRFWNGDSRVTQPTKNEVRDIIKVKGGQNTAILIDDVYIKKLREFQANQMYKDFFKPLPPDFNKELVKAKIINNQEDINNFIKIINNVK